MLMYFLITFVVLAICLSGLALGVIFSNKPIQGSCGGVGRMMGEKCKLCDRKDSCKEEEKKRA